MSSTEPTRILLFAGLRDAAQCEHIDLSVPPHPTAKQIIESISEKLPDAGQLARISRLAVDGQYVSDDFVVTDSSHEIALIPPVSGG